MLEKDIKKVLISHDEIVAAAKKLGAQLTEDYHGKNPILVGVLKGSVPFMAELICLLYTSQIREFAATENAEVVVISARAEEEISELDDEDKSEFLEAIGLTESGVDKLTRAAYHLLGLGTYFTAGEKEVRAWTFKRCLLYTSKQEMIV